MIPTSSLPQFRRYTPTSVRRRDQQGTVLIVSLILLAIITMLTLSSVKSSTMEERLAGNLRDRNLALQAAEAALRLAEDEIENGTLPAFDNTGGYLSQTFNPDVATLDFWQTGTTWKTRTKQANVTLPGVSEKPRYAIQELAPIPLAGGSLKFGPVDGTLVYRVTAIGVGGHPDTRVVLQSTYRR